MKGLGQRLRFARQGRAWSQEEAAARTGLDAGTISRLERDIREPGPRILKALATAYGVSADVLLQLPVRGRRQRRG